MRQLLDRRAGLAPVSWATVEDLAVAPQIRSRRSTVPTLVLARSKSSSACGALPAAMLERSTVSRRTPGPRGDGQEAVVAVGHRSRSSTSSRLLGEDVGDRMRSAPVMAQICDATSCVVGSRIGVPRRPNRRASRAS